MLDMTFCGFLHIVEILLAEYYAIKVHLVGAAVKWTIRASR